MLCYNSYLILFKNEFKGWAKKVTPKAILWTAMSYPLPMDLVSGGHPCCESSASCKNQCSVIKWIIKETSHLAHAYPRLVNPAWVRPFPLWMHIFTHTRLYPYPVPSSILPSSLCSIYLFSWAAELERKSLSYSEICQSLTPHLGCLPWCYISWLLP